MTRCHLRRALGACAIGSLLFAGENAGAGPDLVITEARLDPPTLHALGVQLLITDDDDRDATVTVRYRKQGESAWREGLPLFRVHPEEVSVSIPQQFAGSIFDLEPGTTYEIELHAVDPDGLDQLETLTGTTRALPRAEPATPTQIAVSNVSELGAALGAAEAGHVITLADGNYAGSFFSLNASGTADNPIVIRGASQSGVVIDGENCTGCNILEVYGSYVHIERLTIKNGERAIRFQGTDATNNVVRHVTIEDVVHGIGSKAGQSAFTLCDNHIQGRLVWPWTFDADATSHWDDRGIDVTGDAHVVCHNTIIGFGDPVINQKVQVRSWDVYGNDIRDSFDGTELDRSEGNARLFHNRWTNVMDPVSIQPVYGGPAYVLRNVVMNAPEEQIKLKSLGGTDEPSGVLAYHNTFVSPKLSLNLQAPITTHNFVLSNNLFVGPETLSGSRTVDWTPTVDEGLFDYNGYYPDGGFWFGKDSGGQNVIYDSFAEAQAGGIYEQHGVLLGAPIFAAGFVGPADEQAHQTPPDFTLAAGSNAIDKGLTLPGINAGFLGSAPDLGALELGCAPPSYGPRPVGQEHVTNRIDCNPETQPPGDGGLGGSSGTAGAGNGGSSGSAGSSSGSGGTSSGGASASGEDDDGGCGCRVGSAGSSTALLSLWALAMALLLTRRLCSTGNRGGSSGGSPGR